MLERTRGGFGALPPPAQDLLSDYCSRLKRAGGAGPQPELGAFVHRLGLVVQSRMRYPRSNPASDTDPMAAELDEVVRDPPQFPSQQSQSSA